MLRRIEQVGSVLVLEKPFSMAVFRSVIMEAIGDDSSASWVETRRPVGIDGFPSMRLGER
jgi:hypothetical protein